MSNELTTINDDEMAMVLRSSLYPGASDPSIKMVIAYCRAQNLDPLQKPVHIVPMSVKAGKNANGKDVYETRDVIMPGIGLYRTQAARTHEYAGADEPVFGPDRTTTFRKKFTDWSEGPDGRRSGKDRWEEVSLSFPEWCSVTVYRLVGGVRCPFTAREYWTENYATAGRGQEAPNEMWARRPRGQLAKCAQAQALRMGFPEVGAQPTADEMEGRTWDPDEEHPTARPQLQKPRSVDEVKEAPAAAPPPSSTANIASAAAPPPAREPGSDDEAAGEAAGEATSAGERAFLLNKLKALNIEPAAAMKENGFSNAFDTMTKPQWSAIKTWVGTQKRAA